MKSGVQAEDFNRSRIGTVVALPLSTNLDLADAPGNVSLEHEQTGLSKDSVVVTSQITALDKKKFVERVSALEDRLMAEVEAGVLLVLGMRRLPG